MSSVQRNRGADRRCDDLDGRADRHKDLVKAGVLPAAVLPVSKLSNPKPKEA